MTGGTLIGCPICASLSPGEMTALDSLLADPARWPKTVWGLLGRPKRMTPAARRWGAVEMGLHWLEKNGHADFTKNEVAKHYRDHVPLMETSLVRYGQAATGQDLKNMNGPEALLEFYERALKLGLRSLEALDARMTAMEAAGEEVPIEMLWETAAMGARLGTSAAALSRRSPLELPAGGNTGFRRNVASKRMGHSRIREIDGISMPVHDEGPADREEYAMRARQEGQDGL